jgi:hypothetical protein
MAFEVPKIKKEVYGEENLFRKRLKYYIFGVLGGAGLMGSAFYVTRDPMQYISGMVLIGGSMIGYVADYKHQMGKGFVGRKIYTFADGTRILADDRKSAEETWKKHHEHKKEPNKFGLFHSG